MPTLTITKNYQDGIDLDKSMLDAAFDSVSTFLNTTKIDSNNIQTGGIVGSNIAAGTVTSDRLAPGTLATDRIADAAITTVKIADANVTTAKIADANVTQAKLDPTISLSFVPAGAVLPFAGTAAPSGYLMCDGTAVSRTTYATLFTAIGTAHGTGDGSTTFNLPDYRGRFLRGVDGSATNDPDHASRTAMASGGNTGNAVGTVQGQATRKNGLSLSDPGHSHTVSTTNGTGSGSAVGVAQTTAPFSMSTGTSTTGVSLNNGDNETRPVNAAVNFIIKT